MYDPLSVAAVSGYTLALYLTSRTGSAVSGEAEIVRKSARAILDSKERSVALFGPRSAVINRIYEIVAELALEESDSDPIPLAVVQRAISVIRVLPEGFFLPEIAADPDGSLSLDWISSRTRVFSLSVGPGDRLAFAWIDGTDRGHGVARFEGDALPPRVLSGIREVMNGTPAVRVA